MITKQEWKFVGWVGVAVVLLTSLPLVFGYFSAPPQTTFLFRSNNNAFDIAVYYSKIEQVKAGQVFLKYLFTSEAQAVGVISPFWLMVGWFAKLFSLPAFAAYQLARLALIPVFLATAYWLGTFFLQDIVKRKIYFLLLVFASGWGWLALVALNLLHTDVASILDINVPEAFAFLSLYAQPNFVASLVLIILIFVFSLLAFTSYRYKYTFLAAVSAFVLFSFHPYHVPTVFGVLGMMALVLAIKEKRINVRRILHMVIMGLFSLPPVLYYAWAIANIPAMYQHSLQNITLTPNILITVMSYGLLLPLALLGSFTIFKKKDKTIADIFLLVWFFTQSCLIYLPIKTQQRLVEGLQIPMVLLVVCGLFFLKDFLWQKPFFQKAVMRYGQFFKDFPVRFFIGLALIFLFCFSSVFVLVNDMAMYQQGNMYFYISDDKLQAMRWLKDVPENSAILSLLENGNLIPAFSVKQVFLGHGHETAHFIQKRAAVDYFFEKSSAPEREAILKQYGITHIFFGPEEKKKAHFNPDDDAFLTKVFQNSSVAIYAVD